MHLLDIIILNLHFRVIIERHNLLYKPITMCHCQLCFTCLVSQNLHFQYVCLEKQ
jgi:hypothetical protein